MTFLLHQAPILCTMCRDLKAPSIQLSAICEVGIILLHNMLKSAERLPGRGCNTKDREEMKM